MGGYERIQALGDELGAREPEDGVDARCPGECQGSGEEASLLKLHCRLRGGGLGGLVVKLSKSMLVDHP